MTISKLFQLRQEVMVGHSEIYDQLVIRKKEEEFKAKFGILFERYSTLLTLYVFPFSSPLSKYICIKCPNCNSSVLAKYGTTSANLKCCSSIINKQQLNKCTYNIHVGPSILKLIEQYFNRKQRIKFTERITSSSLVTSVKHIPTYYNLEFSLKTKLDSDEQMLGILKELLQ